MNTYLDTETETALAELRKNPEHFRAVCRLVRAGARAAEKLPPEEWKIVLQQAIDGLTAEATA